MLNVLYCSKVVIYLMFCLPVTSQEPGGDKLPAAAAAAPSYTEPQPITAAVPGLLTLGGGS